MWNEPEQPPAYAGQPDDAGHAAQPQQAYAPQPAYEDAVEEDPYAEVTFTPDQQARMENEWRRLQRAFAYHPHVTLSPLRGDPPFAYQADFRLTTVVVNPRSGQLEYVQNATVQITLPPGFPEQPPEVKPVTAIFHPNVSYDGLYLGNLWHPNETLLGLIRKVGEVLAYRHYDQDYTVNPAALEWVAANYAVLPTDPQANLTATAGGEPLSRLIKYGAQSLESMKQSMLATQSSLYGQSAPDHANLKAYAHKTRLALNLFLEKDVPEDLQVKANELDDACREIVSLLPLYDYARERRKRIATLRQAARHLLGAKDPLAAEVDKLAALVDAGEPTEPMVALKMIPDAGRLQPLQFSLPRLVGDAEKRVLAVQTGQKALEELARPQLFIPDSLLGKRLEKELATTDADAETVRKEAHASLLTLSPVLKRAVAEGVALDFAARWREYMDMAAKAKSMERQIREWGSAGLQAYFIENESGRFGPYQFEQPVDLGTGELVVRSLGGKALEVREPATERSLGQGQAGAVTVALPGPAEPGQPPVSFPTTFRATERCDDLMVLLEFLRRSTIETVTKFAAYAGPAESWAGKVCRILSRPEVKKGLEDELARAARRWRHTIHDLAALGPWKERAATLFVARRCSQVIPELVAAITDRKAKHKASKQRTGEILSRSGQDPDTGRTIIAPKYAKAYADEMSTQKECEDTVRRSQALLKAALSHLRARVGDPRTLGKGELPPLRAVPPLPADLAALPVADGQLGNLLYPIEQLLNVELGGPLPAPEEAPAEAYAEGQYAEGQYAEGEYAEGQYAEPAPDEAHAGEGQYAEGDATAEGAYVEEYAAEGEAGVEEVQELSVDEVAAEESVEALPAEALIEEVEEVPPAPMPTPAVTAPKPPPVHARPPAVATAPAKPTVAAPPPVEVQAHDYAVEVAAEEWVVEEDEATQYGEGHEGDDQSDIVFGFEPDPAPAAPPPPAKRK